MESMKKHPSGTKCSEQARCHFLALFKQGGLDLSQRHGILEFIKDFPIHFSLKALAFQADRYNQPHFVGKTFLESCIWLVELRPSDQGPPLCIIDPPSLGKDLPYPLQSLHFIALNMRERLNSSVTQALGQILIQLMTTKPYFALRSNWKDFYSALVSQLFPSKSLAWYQPPSGLQKLSASIALGRQVLQELGQSCCSQRSHSKGNSGERQSGAQVMAFI